MNDTVIQAEVTKAPFGQTRIVAQIGNVILKHLVLFKKEHTERAERLADQISNALSQADDPFSVLNFDFWEGPGAGFEKKSTVYKPKTD